MAATKLPKGYYDPADHVLVHKDYLNSLVDALNHIHATCGDPVIENICDRALGQKVAVDAVDPDAGEGQDGPRATDSSSSSPARQE